MEYRERKEDLASRNSVVVRPIARLTRDVVSKKRAAKAKRFTPTKMLNGINAYFCWCEENDEVPSVKGLTLHLGMYRTDFYAYLKYPEFSDMLEQARLIIAEWAERDVYNTKGMAAGKIAYMKNIHGWSDKIETNNYTEQRVITKEEAYSKIEMLAPKLLEALQRSHVLQQIGHAEEAEVIHGKSEGDSG